MNTKTFKCDLCGDETPETDRTRVEMATLSPYPEDADLCPHCVRGNNAEWREILQQKRLRAEENFDMDYLRNH